MDAGITYARNILDEPSCREVVDLIHRKADFFERRGYPYHFCYNANPEMVNDGGKIIYRDVELNCFRYDSAGQKYREPYVKTPEDLDKILSIPYVPDYSGIDLAEEERVTRFLDEMLRRCIDRYRYLLEHGIGDVFWMAGSEFAVPPMLSPAHFHKYVTPYSKALVDLVHSYGKKVMIHCHGRIRMVLEEFKEIGMDMLHPIEASPMGDCTLTQAREVLGEDVTFVGNIQVGDIYSKSKEELRQIVKEAMLEGKKGRFVLAMTASPIYPELDDHLKENYMTVVETALEFAGMNGTEN